MAKSGGNGVRVGLTLRPELDSVLTKIADFEKRPKTAVINDYLMECLPVFSQIAQAYDLIKEDKDPSKVLNQIAAMTLQNVGTLGNVMHDSGNVLHGSDKCPDTLELPL